MLIYTRHTLVFLLVYSRYNILYEVQHVLIISSHLYLPAIAFLINFLYLNLD